MIGRGACWIVLLSVSAAAHGADVATDSETHLEQQARARLVWLREQVAAQQRKIRELEELLDEKTQIVVRMQLVEVDAAEGREAGFPIPGGDGAVRTIPTAALDEQQRSDIVTPHEAKDLIDALVEHGHAKPLASPIVQTENNREGTILSGGEFPILVPQTQDSVGIEWREFGTKATVHPIILENGRVRVRFQASVSERDFANAVKVQGMTVPGLTSRAVNSSVEMDFDKTLILCAGTSRKSRDVVEQTPILNKLPQFKRLYKQAAAVEEPSETALIVLVTPSLVPPGKD